jgi:hypothetical protein
MNTANYWKKQGVEMSKQDIAVLTILDKLTEPTEETREQMVLTFMFHRIRERFVHLLQDNTLLRIGAEEEQQ